MFFFSLKLLCPLKGYQEVAIARNLKCNRARSKFLRVVIICHLVNSLSESADVYRIPVLRHCTWC